MNSGAIYRSIAHIADTNSIPLDDTEKLISIGESIRFNVNLNSHDADIVYKDEIINKHIFNEEIAKIASKISSNKDLRESLVSIQRSFAKEPGLIAEGRDMGNVIFPNADIKFFMNANNKTRAKRRFKQLKEEGFNVSLTQLIDELNARDKRDKTRKVSPLVIPEDSILIKTDNKTINEVRKEVINHIENKIYE